MNKTIFTLITLAFFGLSTTYAQVGIGTTTPDASAILELESTEKGFLPPRMSTLERDGINIPVEGLVIYNTDSNTLEFFNGVQWIHSSNGKISSGPCSGESTEFIFKELTYKPVESSGKCWLDRNLGATQVATASNDAASYGDLYQWGRAADGHEKRNSATYNAKLSSDGVANFNASGNAWDGEFILRNLNANNWVDPNVSGVDNLWQGVNGTNNPCPTGYRVPTETELNAERLSWSSTSNNSAGAFASPLKWPAAGFRSRANGSLFGVDSRGRYWSSTVSGAAAGSLFFDSDAAGMLAFVRAYGRSVRCLKD